METEDTLTAVFRGDDPAADPNGDWEIPEASFGADEEDESAVAEPDADGDARRVRRIVARVPEPDPDAAADAHAPAGPAAGPATAA